MLSSAPDNSTSAPSRPHRQNRLRLRSRGRQDEAGDTGRGPERPARSRLRDSHRPPRTAGFDRRPPHSREDVERAAADAVYAARKGVRRLNGTTTAVGRGTRSATCATASARRRERYQKALEIRHACRALRTGGNLTFSEAEALELYPKGRASALYLGERSGGLVDIDLDCIETRRAAQCYYPTQTWSAAGGPRPDSHYFYKVADPPRRASEKFRDPYGTGLVRGLLWSSARTGG